MTRKRKVHRQKAVALRYDQEQDTAPRVVAKGSGLIAEQIIATALEHGVHIREDPDLVAVLSKLDVDTAIPADMYRAVAEVLAFVYRLNQAMQESDKPLGGNAQA